MTDSHSPLAYVIVAETHWYDPEVRHFGVEITLRFAQNIAYILGGRDLVNSTQIDRADPMFNATQHARYYIYSPC